MSASHHRTVRLLELGSLICILVLAAFLRLAYVTDNPGWYADEGTHLNIAQNLAAGRVQYLAVTRSTLLFAKLPLFDRLLAGLVRVWPADMTTLRTLSGLLGVISVVILYVVVRRIKPTRPGATALLSALLLAIYPDATLYSRFGFSYNLLAPLVLVAYLGMWQYARTHQRQTGTQGRPSAWLALAAGAIGVGTVSDLWMFAVMATMVAVVATARWQDLVWSLPLALLPFATYAAVMLVRDSRVFILDLQYTLTRVQGVVLAVQARTLALNYTRLVSNSWVALALVGFALLRPARLRHLSFLCLLVPIAVVGRTVALYSLSYYYVIPVLPLIALGVASAVVCGGSHLARSFRFGLQRLTARRRRIGTAGARPQATSRIAPIAAYLLVSVIVATPLATYAVFSVGQVVHGYQTEIDPFLLNPQDAREAAAFLNAQTQSDDVVVASPALAWLLTAQAADIQMSVASRGMPTSHIPSDIPADRFAFNPDYAQARYVAIDNLWRNWAVWHIDTVSDIIRTVEQ
jgi:hypothetical protein